MPITVATYDRARALLDDPELDPERKAKLQAKLSEYETGRMTAGLPQFGMQTSAEAIEGVEKALPPRTDPNAKPMVGGTRRATAGDVAGSRPELSPEEAYRQSIDEANIEDMQMSGETEYNEKEYGASASKLKHLYAPPEFMPEGGGFMDYATATYFYEPPLELAKEALRPRIGDARADALTENDADYKRFADAMWKETYEKAGKPAVRVAYMNTDSWGKKLAYGQAKGLEFAYPLATGIDRSLTGGLASEAVAAGLESEPGRRARQAQVEASPVMTGAGAIVGALAPGGLTGRVYSNISRGVAPAGSGLGRRMAGAAAGGSAAGAVDTLAQAGVHNVSEQLLTENPRILSEKDVLNRLSVAAPAGAAGGMLGEGVASLAGAGVRAVRSGDLGSLVRRAEQGGVTTSARGGAKPSKDIAAIEQGALALGRDPRDLMASELTAPLARAGFKLKTDTVARAGAEKTAAYASPGAGPKPVTALVDAVHDRMSKLFDADGAVLPGKREELAILRRWRDQLVKNVGGKVSPRELDANQLDELVDDIYFKASAEKAPGPYTRLYQSALKVRDEAFGDALPGEPPVFKGDRELRGVSAMKARHEQEVGDVENVLQGAGLPIDMRPRAGSMREEAPLPQLDANQTQALTNNVAAFRSGKGHEVRDIAIARLGELANKSGELDRIAAYDAFKELQKAAQFRTAVGSNLTPSFYTANPRGAVALRVDPMMRALSGAAPDATPISDALYELIQKMAGKGAQGGVTTRSALQGRLDPLSAIHRAGRRASARQLGKAGAGGDEGSERKRTLADLSPEEARILIQLVEVSAGQRPAASGE